MHKQNENNQLRSNNAFHLLKWEFRKNRYGWALWAIIGSIILNVSIGISQYLRYQPDFIVQHYTWEAVWAQGMSLWGLLFLPIIIGTIQAQRVANESKARGFERLHIFQTHRRFLLVSYLQMFLISIFTVTSLGIILVSAGLSIGFNLDLWPRLVAGLAVIAVAIFAQQATSFAVSLKIKAFSLAVGIIFFFTLIGMALYVTIPIFGSFFPFGLIAAATAASSGADFGTPTVIIVPLLSSLLWLLLSWIFLTRSISKVK